MKVVFISCYLSIHQLPFCLEMDGLTNGNFTYISTSPINEERLSFGYPDLDRSYPFVLRTYETPENIAKAKQLILDADVVISGSAPDEFIVPRLKARKLTFKYSERPCKEQNPRLLLKIRRIIGQYLHHGRFQKYPLYMLCASAYTAADYAKYGNYIGKTFKWGYFPEVKQQNLQALSASRHADEIPVILWAGRLLKWKHVEMAVLAAEALKQSKERFRLEIIGNGSLEAELKAMVGEKGLQDCVHFLGAMPPEKVRQHMEAADIYLFTSDFNEGWGAVLNESMNSACAVVASHAIGSVPYLMDDGKNGLIYQNGDQKQLNEKIAWLLHHPEEREKMGEEAYQTLAEVWNAKSAAERFLKLAAHIQSGQPGSPFSAGPCSKAEILENDWYREY